MYLILSLCQKKAGHVSTLLPGEHAQFGTITLVLSQVFALHIEPTDVIALEEESLSNNAHVWDNSLKAVTST